MTWGHSGQAVSGEQNANHIPLVVDMVADELEQRLCAITVNADAIARMLDSRSPDVTEIRAALADITSEAQGACESMRAARSALWRRVPVRARR